MARHLYRLGRWSFSHRRTVVSLWVLALIVVGAAAATISKPSSNTFSLPGIESTQAFDLIKDRTGQSADGATARIVFQAPKGQDLASAKNQALISSTLEAVGSTDVAAATPPSAAAGTISQDGRTGVASVTFTKQSIDLSDAQKEAITEAPEEARAAGLTVAVGGDAVQEQSATGATELIGVLIALVVLVITFGSMLAAGMPLLTAIVGVGIGIAGITAASAFVDLSSTTPVLALMLGLAVGIDYALFIVTRYRSELALGRAPLEAIGRAVGTAGSAVVFAGITVIIALAGLAVVNINFLTQMGVAAAATVAVAVMIALTLLPAMLGFAGSRITRRLGYFARRAEKSSAGTPAGRRWVDLVTRHRVVVFFGGLVVAVLVAIPAGSLRLAFPDEGTATEGSGPRVAYDLIADNFGPGVNGPLVVVVDTKGSSDAQATIDSVNKAVASVKTDIASVVPAGPTGDDAKSVAAFKAQVDKTQIATITVIPKSGPSEASTQDLVSEIRDAVRPAAESTGGDALVTGQTAVAIDISDSLSSAFPRYLLVVVGLALFLLIGVFRSILVPVKAVLGFLVSVLMALGATVAVFQWGWLAGLMGVDTPGPVLSFLPVLLTGILFGLAMDYELFLVTRMREEYVHGTEAREAVNVGFEHGARVVTAAALIMISVFSSFILSPEPITKSIGFGLAFGVLADAFLVRMTLVPAFMSIIGKPAWWIPGWLSRLIPDLDVEGDKLTKELDSEPVPAR
jgi:RND superfamily putative drug exporter